MGQFTALQNPQFQVIHSLLNDYMKEGKNMINTHTHTHTHTRARAQCPEIQPQTFKDCWGHQKDNFMQMDLGSKACRYIAMAMTECSKKIGSRNISKNINFIKNCFRQKLQGVKRFI